MNKLFNVRRLNNACCGMENGKIYKARWSNPGIEMYVEIQLPNGEWTSGHWFKGFFEIVEG